MMNKRTRNLLHFLGFPLALFSNLGAQQPHEDPERRTLTNLRTFAVYAQVQVSQRATLDRIDEGLLRAKLELALRREGISIQGPGDVRDGSQAQISLVYLVLETGNDAGRETGFAASFCLNASQLVTIPRLSRGRITYTVATTWSSCGMLVGDRDSFTASILRNADEQVARFLHDWRIVNQTPAPPVISNPELGFGRAQADWRAKRPGGRQAQPARKTASCLTA